MSQVELAKRLDVSRASVFNWETERTAIRNDKLPSLAKVLDIPLASLYAFAEDKDLPKITVQVGGPGVGRSIRWVPLIRWSDLSVIGPDGTLVAVPQVQSEIALHPDFDRESWASWATMVPDDSMDGDGADVFREGDAIVFAAGVEPATGNFVLVRLETGEHLFRSYVSRPRGVYDLVASNPDFPTITVNAKNPGTLLGVLVEHRRRFLLLRKKGHT